VLTIHSGSLMRTGADVLTAVANDRRSRRAPGVVFAIACVAGLACTTPRSTPVDGGPGAGGTAAGGHGGSATGGRGGSGGGTGGSVVAGAGGSAGTGGSVVGGAGGSAGTGGSVVGGAGGNAGTGGSAGTGGTSAGGKGGTTGTGGSSGTGGSAGTGGSGCALNMKRCNGNQPQQCDGSGVWQNNGSACTSVCSPCSTATGTCMAVTDGTGCNDNNACTQTDKCQSGVCVGMNPVTCAAPTTCHVQGTCDMVSGQCSNPNAPDDTTACNSGLGVCKTGSCSTPVFTRLGASVYARGISADGSIVVGSSVAVSMFRWTRATGFVALPAYMNATDCAVSGISANGTYAVGNCMSQMVAVRWMGTNAPASLGLPGGFMYGSADAASTDASVMTGFVDSTTNGNHMGLWRNGAGPTFLDGPTNTNNPRGVAVNGDGTVIVGYAYINASGSTLGFRWTQAGGATAIPFFSGDTYADATGVSSDGNKVVGSSMSGPYLYNASTGTITRVTYPGDTGGYGRAISGDGTTIAGNTSSGVWLSVNGGTPQLLGATLAALGVDLTGFSLTDVYYLSANGKVIVGNGFMQGGSSDEGWIVVLP
jgi:hypothetical protein